MIQVNNNFDENTMNNIKNMVDSGDINGAISQISPEMIQNFSSMMQNNTSSSSKFFSDSSSQSNNSNSNNNQGGFDFSNIDMNTILKLKSVMEKMNKKNDPRANLLYSLKPYLREEKKEKLDQYANLLNVANIVEALKNENKENNNG